MNSEILRIIDKETGEVLSGLSVDGVVFCVSEGAQCDQAIQHRGENGGETVASLTNALKYPAFRFSERPLPHRPEVEWMEKFQNIIHR